MKKTTIISALVLLCTTGTLRADCPFSIKGTPFIDGNDPDLSTEKALWDAHNQCAAKWENPGGAGDGKWYPKIQYVFHNYRSSDWNDHGFQDACNLERDYTRLWSSDMMIDQGLNDVEGRQRHSSDDYQRSVWGHSNSLHDFFHYLLDDDIDHAAQYDRPIFGENKISLSCQVFSEDMPFGNAATRPATKLHESWHAWQTAHGYKVDHVDGPNRHCTMNWCDWWYYHGTQDFPFGHIGDYDAEREHPLFHSPAQVQVEFMCDVWPNAKKWVPGIIRVVTQDMADAMADLHFVNRAWHCLTPRPLNYGVERHVSVN